MLYVISAPSGAGKSTLCKEIIRRIAWIKLSVSYTTRKPRKGEINDVHYTFISEKKFKNMIHKKEFAEWARVHGNFYGTSHKRLKKLSKEGYDIVLDIDVQGARQIKKTCKNAVYVFILPPSMNVLRQRLANRKSEDEKKIRQRLERAKDEILSYKEYDYVIINDKLEKAYRQLESIILADRIRTENIDSKFIKNLLK